MVKSSSQSLRPVQVVMDANRYLVMPDTPTGGGASKDFFKDDDDGFYIHKQKIKTDLSNYADTLTKNGESVGFVHVQLREQALAKSHRPLDSVFSESNRFGIVGGERDGQLIVQAAPRALKELAERIDSKAEQTPLLKRNTKNGEMEPRVSRIRSEVGAIDKLRLHNQRDRLQFEAQEAISYLSRDGVIGSYIVDLFNIEVSLLSPGAVNKALGEFIDSLNRLSGGLLIRPTLPDGLRTESRKTTISLSIKLLSDSKVRIIELPPELMAGRQRDLESTDIGVRSVDLLKGIGDLDVERHKNLLGLLAEQTLVRTVHLPPVIDEYDPVYATNRVSEPLPTPQENVQYPVLGIIDGGVKNIEALEPWIVGGLGLVPESDASKAHGTRIAALAVAGASMNPHVADVVEPDGVKIYDLDIFPRKDLRTAYYADYHQFLDQLEESIVRAKTEYGVRIFNFSIASGSSTSGQYTVVAEGFDAISVKHNVLFVVSAGNLLPIDSRPPWPVDPNAAVQMLAAQSSNQRLFPPAEAFHAITVGAVNPPNQKGHEAFLPTNYTRRGPGSGHSRKPDLSHIGGTSIDSGGGNKTGLVSLDESASWVEINGTSFAAPIVATTLATLDRRLLSKASPELLRALMIHKAEKAKPLRHKNIAHIAQEFVGYGRPLPADAVLVDDFSEITLVFNETLPKGRVLEFNFSWPQCLVDQGKCRGRAVMTLVYLPPIDRNFEDEAMRLELEVYLRQQNINKTTGEVVWQGRAIADGMNVPSDIHRREKETLKRGVKWSPVKRLSLDMARGRGNSSDWKIVVQTLTRKGIEFPESGVDFALLLSISDSKNEEPVYDEMRNQLLGLGVTLADIEVSTRVVQSVSS